MKQLILILMLALGVTSQAQTFNFSCAALTDTEIQGQQINVVLDEVSDLAKLYNPLLDIAIIYGDLTEKGDEIDLVVSTLSSVTLLYNDVPPESEIHDDNKDDWELLYTVYLSAVDYIGVITSTYQAQTGG